MSDRDLHSIVFEADYWRAMLDEVLELNGLIAQTAEQLVPVPVILLPLAVRSSETDHQVFNQVATRSGESLALLEKMQGSVLRLVELSGGRYRALRREAGLEEPGGDDEHSVKA